MVSPSTTFSDSQNMARNRVRQDRRAALSRTLDFLMRLSNFFFLGGCFFLLVGLSTTSLKKEDSSKSSPVLLLQSEEAPQMLSDNKAPAKTKPVFLNWFLFAFFVFIHYHWETIAQTIQLFRGQGAAVELEDARSSHPVENVPASSSEDRRSALPVENTARRSSDDVENMPAWSMEDIIWGMTCSLTGLVASLYLIVVQE